MIFKAFYPVTVQRILLVDDDPTWRYAAAKALIGAGYEVVSASDYMAALDLVGATPPIDILVTDIVMPKGMNGFALARMARLRQRDLKVIYMTGYDVPTHEAVGKVIRKPIDPTHLIDEVRAALAA